MAWNSLILGIAFSIGVFATKSGVGLFYYLSKMTTSRARSGVWVGFAFTYGLVFAASGLILEGMDLVHHLEAIQGWIQSGMLVHLLMASMMMFWGVRLLMDKGNPSIHSKGWLMLAVPCPVCVTVILFSLGFLTAVYPDSPWMMAFMLYLAFLLINGITLRLMAAGWWKGSPESLLGASLLIIAAYFFLSVTVMPNFTDMDKIYSMARYPSDMAQVDRRHLLLFLIGIAAAFLIGIAAVFRRMRRSA